MCACVYTHSPADRRHADPTDDGSPTQIYKPTLTTTPYINTHTQEKKRKLPAVFSPEVQQLVLDVLAEFFDHDLVNKVRGCVDAWFRWLIWLRWGGNVCWGRWMLGWVDVSVALLSSSPRAPPGGDRQTDGPFPTTTHTKTPKPQTRRCSRRRCSSTSRATSPRRSSGRCVVDVPFSFFYGGGGHTNTTIMMPSAISLISLYIHLPDPKQTNNPSR